MRDRVGCALKQESTAYGAALAVSHAGSRGGVVLSRPAVVSVRDVRMKGATGAQTSSEGPTLPGRAYVALTGVSDAGVHPYQTTVRADLSRRRGQEVRDG